jgi:hypothetical protein
LFASHIAYLNDSTEFVLALTLTKSVVSDQKQGVSGAKKEYYEAIGNYVNRLLHVSPVHNYVASFCADGDALMLWRSYCPEEAGYALGYDWNRVESPQHIIAPCIYNEELQRSIIEEQLKKYEQADPEPIRKRWKGHKEYKEYIKDNELRATGFAEKFYMFAASFKNKAFENECEWRIILPHLADYSIREEYRSGKRTIVPYTKLSLVANNILHFDELVIGPTSMPKLGAHALERFIKEWNRRDERMYEIVCENNVRLSTVPYRVI